MARYTGATNKGGNSYAIEVAGRSTTGVVLFIG